MVNLDDMVEYMIKIKVDQNDKSSDWIKSVSQETEDTAVTGKFIQVKE